MSRREKYDAFETVTVQATGRRVDARAMDEEISAGPYAAQWNSGFVLDEKTGASDDLRRGELSTRRFRPNAPLEHTVEELSRERPSRGTTSQSSSPRTSSRTPSPSNVLVSANIAPTPTAAVSAPAATASR